MAPELKIFLMAMIPVGELRAAFPVAINYYQLPIYSAYFFSVLGNLVPPIFILLFLKFGFNYFSQKSYIFNRFSNWLIQRTHNSHFKRVEKLKEWALLSFVAIPLPFTGAWTGSLVAFVFNFPFKRSLFIIGLGVMIAGIIVSCLTFGGVFLEKNFGWQGLLGVLVALGFLYYLYYIIKKR